MGNILLFKGSNNHRIIIEKLAVCQLFIIALAIFGAVFSHTVALRILIFSCYLLCLATVIGVSSSKQKERNPEQFWGTLVSVTAVFGWLSYLVFGQHFFQSWFDWLLF